MSNGDHYSRLDPSRAIQRGKSAAGTAGGLLDSADPQVVETTISPFHCLYQDALWFHTQSHLRLPRSESESSRLARAALLLYLESAEALLHQAAVELARPEHVHLIADPHRPMPLGEAWALLPMIVAEERPPALDLKTAPWPQFAELVALRTSWAYPGPPEARKAYYIASPDGSSFDPIPPEQLPMVADLEMTQLRYPRTGLPQDPYALRPQHLDTAKQVLDQAMGVLDRRLGGALTKNGRHRREPVRILHASR